MDPLSIGCACVSLVGGVTNLITKITLFALEVRGARRDMDIVSRELMSLKMSLMAIDSDDGNRRLNLPSDIRKQLGDVLINIDLITQQMSRLLSKLDSGRLGRRVQWAMIDREEMNQLRSSLESNKTALDIALTLGTITVLAEQRNRLNDQSDDISLLLANTQAITLNTDRIDHRLGVLTDLHLDSSRFESISAELIELRKQLAQVSKQGKGSQTLQVFVNQSQEYVRSVILPVENELSLPEQSGNTLTTPPGLLTPTPGSPRAANVSLCPACARPSQGEAEAVAIGRFVQRFKQAKNGWEQQLKSKTDEMNLLREEIDSLKQSQAESRLNSPLESPAFTSTARTLSLTDSRDTSISVPSTNAAQQHTPTSLDAMSTRSNERGSVTQPAIFELPSTPSLRSYEWAANSRVPIPPPTDAERVPSYEDSEQSTSTQVEARPVTASHRSNPRPLPLMEFRVTRDGEMFQLEPITFSNLTSLDEVTQKFVAQLHFNWVHKQRKSAHLKFSDQMFAEELRKYIVITMGGFARFEHIDQKRIFLQVRSTLLRSGQKIYTVGISSGTSLWVMLAPYKKDEPGKICNDDEMWIEEPSRDDLQVSLPEIARPPLPVVSKSSQDVGRRQRRSGISAFFQSHPDGQSAQSPSSVDEKYVWL